MASPGFELELDSYKILCYLIKRGNLIVYKSVIISSYFKKCHLLKLDLLCSLLAIKIPVINSKILTAS
jgi:hypothetical protein